MLLEDGREILHSSPIPETNSAPFAEKEFANPLFEMSRLLSSPAFIYAQVEYLLFSVTRLAASNTGGEYCQYNWLFPA